MKVMTAATLILVAPCSLLLGAALQILVARLCSARTKGILAFLSCICRLLVAVAWHGAFRFARDRRLSSSLFQWDSPFGAGDACGRAERAFCVHGLVDWRAGAAVLDWVHGARQGRDPVLRLDADLFIGGFVGLVYSANLFAFLSVLGSWWGLCSFSLVGFWYTNREAVAGARTVLLMTHIAGYGLLASILVLYHRTGSRALD